MLCLYRAKAANRKLPAAAASASGDRFDRAHQKLFASQKSIAQHHTELAAKKRKHDAIKISDRLLGIKPAAKADAAASVDAKSAAAADAKTQRTVVVPKSKKSMGAVAGVASTSKTPKAAARAVPAVVGAGARPATVSAGVKTKSAIPAEIKTTASTKPPTDENVPPAGGADSAPAVQANHKRKATELASGGEALFSPKKKIVLKRIDTNAAPATATAEAGNVAPFLSHKKPKITPLFQRSDPALSKSAAKPITKLPRVALLAMQQKEQAAAAAAAAAANAAPAPVVVVSAH